jgi:hypothetical protein
MQTGGLSRPPVLHLGTIVIADEAKQSNFLAGIPLISSFAAGPLT